MSRSDGNPNYYERNAVATYWRWMTLKSLLYAVMIRLERALQCCVVRLRRVGGRISFVRNGKSGLLIPPTRVSVHNQLKRTGGLTCTLIAVFHLDELSASGLDTHLGLPGFASGKAWKGTTATY